MKKIKYLPLLLLFTYAVPNGFNLEKFYASMIEQSMRVNGDALTCDGQNGSVSYDEGSGAGGTLKVWLADAAFSPARTTKGKCISSGIVPLAGNLSNYEVKVASAVANNPG